MTAAEYLEGAVIAGKVRVFNFCKSYKYQSIGYYVSLIAEARGHEAYPSMAAMSDIKSASIIRTVSEDLKELIEKTGLSLDEIKKLSNDQADFFNDDDQENIKSLFNKLLKDIRNKFSPIIERQISMLILKDYKLSFFPKATFRV